MQTTNFRDQFTDIADACALAQSIVDTVREPVVVLDKGLRVVAASRSFYSAFKVRPEDTQSKLLYALGDGQWDIPKLRVLLEKILPEHGVMEDYEVEHEFPDLGNRTMSLNARQVFYKGGADTTILLGIEDVTERRILEREKDDGSSRVHSDSPAYTGIGLTPDLQRRLGQPDASDTGWTQDVVLPASLTQAMAEPARGCIEAIQ